MVVQDGCSRLFSRLFSRWLLKVVAQVVSMWSSTLFSELLLKWKVVKMNGHHWWIVVVTDGCNRS